MPTDAERIARQKTVAAWCVAAFGADQASDVPQRGLRLAEEAIEAAQSAGCDPAQLHRLVDYVYARPAGGMKQELGGVGVTALALADACGIDCDAAEAAEVARVLAKPLEHFTARNQAKNDAGFLAQRAQAPDSGWRGIESAPKRPQGNTTEDAPRIYVGDGISASVAYWDWYYAADGDGFSGDEEDAWREPISSEPISGHFSPTHWRPLPPPPNKKEPENG